jgi:O-antigen ligase/tetratricopeptide (TPR) repeat protein
LTAADSAEAVELLEFPPWLERFIRAGMLFAFTCVLLLPFVGGMLSLLIVTLPLDSGCNTILMRTLLHSMAIFGTVLLVLAPRASSPNDRPLAGSIGLLLAVWGMAALVSVCLYDSAMQWCELLIGFGFLLVCRELCRTARMFSVALHILLGAGALSALLALYLYVDNHTADTAVTGTFYQADVAAGYLLTLFPLALSMFVGARRFEHRMLYGLLSLLFGMLLVLTYSRGGLLSVVLAVLALLPLWWSLWARLGTSGLRRAGLVLGAPLLIGLAVAVLAGLLSSRGHVQIVPHKVISRESELVSGGDSSVVARLEFWKGSWKLFLQRPLLGWGPAAFGRVFPRVQTDPRWYSKFAHNQYAAFLCEGGSLTILALINCWGVLAWLLWRAWRSTVEAWPARQGRGEFAPVELNPFALAGIMGSLVAIVLHIGVDVDWEFPAVMMMFFILAGMGLEPKTDLDRQPSVVASSSPWHWLISLPLMGLLMIQPAGFVASQRERASQDAHRHNDFKVALENEFEAARWMPYSSQYRRSLTDLLNQLATRSTPPDKKLADEAVRQARIAVRLDGFRAVNQDALARALRVDGMPDEALATEERAIACDPINYPSFYDNKAQILIEQKKMPEAWKTLMVAYDMYPDQLLRHAWYFRRDSINAQLYNVCLTLARIAQQQKQNKDAITFYERAIQCDSNAILPRFQSAMLDMGMGDPGEAFLQLREIQRLKPKEALSNWLLGLCYRELGLPARADELMNEAYKTRPDLRDKATQHGSATLTIPPDFFAPTAPAPASGPRVEGM